MKILMVLTSHDTLGNTGQKTGLWLEEFAAPYFVFLDAGVDVTVASPKGGQPPIDSKSHALRHVKDKGDPLVKGKRVTAFTNEEEEAVQLTKVAPFWAACSKKKPDWEVHSIVDGLLVTGQSPASSTEAALALLNAMK